MLNGNFNKFILEHDTTYMDVGSADYAGAIIGERRIGKKDSARDYFRIFLIDSIIAAASANSAFALAKSISES